MLLLLNPQTQNSRSNPAPLCLTASPVSWPPSLVTPVSLEELVQRRLRQPWLVRNHSLVHTTPPDVCFPIQRPLLCAHGCSWARGPTGSGSPEVATFASGCFWGVEHIFLKHFPPKENKGVLKTAVGYTGGKEGSQNPDYKTVCTGTTDHAEAVRIEFDPSIVKYEELVGESHNPTRTRRAFALARAG